MQSRLLALCIALSIYLVSGSARWLIAQNPIVVENAHEGSLDWQLTRVRVDGGQYRSQWIEGYCSKQSVAAGEKIDVMVSTNPARAFKFELFRMGYYGGRGARLMKTWDRLEGKSQPVPEPGEKNLHECRWQASLTIDIPKDWTSGVYLGRMTTIPEAKKPIGRTMWCSLFATIDLWMFSFNVLTTRGKPTIRGPANSLSIRIPKATKVRGPMSVLIDLTRAKLNTPAW